MDERARLFGDAGKMSRQNDWEAVQIDMTEGLKNFAAQYNYAINDPELIRRYRFYEDGRRDEATRLSVATKRAMLEAARKMKAEGITADVISRVTDIPTTEIAKL